MGRVHSAEVQEAVDESCQEARIFTRLCHSRRSRVLVIEDDEELNRAVSRALEHQGHHVGHALDGLEGLERIAVEGPDLVVLDLDLPKLGGFGLLQRVRAELGPLEMPFVILTGKSDPELERKLTAWGAERLLRKPAPLREIARVVGEVLATT